MSVIKPEIDNLLDKTEHNPFLLCSIASKRACDINNMVRGQHLRVASGKDPVSIAMQEIESDTLGFVKEDFDEDIKGANTIVL